MSLKKMALQSAQVVLSLFPLTLRRLLFSYFYNKDWFLLKSSENVFTEIYQTNLWESDESRSGGGSTMMATKVIRSQLPEIIRDYSVKSMLDIPCGDYNWMKTVDKGCEYIGADVVEELIESNKALYSSEKVQFRHLDLIHDDLPKVDLIFCRDCLQHLSYSDVMNAVNNIKRSGSSYLLVTSYHRTKKNHDIHSGDYRALNLLIPPFRFPKPLSVIEEKPKEHNTEIDKTMYLFACDSLPAF